MDSLGLLGFLKAKKVKAEIDEINQPIKFTIDENGNVIVDGQSFYPPIGDEVAF